MAREAQIVVRREEHHTAAVDADFGIGCRFDGQQAAMEAGTIDAIELGPQLGFELGVPGHRAAMLRDWTLVNASRRGRLTA